MTYDLTGTYKVDELKELGVSVGGQEPIDGWVTIEKGTVLDYSLKFDEYTVDLNEDNESETSKNGTIRKQICENRTFNPSPEEWFNFDSSTGTITGFSESGTTDITIPCQIDGVDVVSIGIGAFANKNLTSVILNDNITTIENSAFYGNSLTVLKIPNNIETIGIAAFHSNQLTNLTIGKSVYEIKLSAFYGNQLKKLIIPGNVKTIGLTAFYDNQLTTVNIEEGVEILDEGCFNSNKLTEIIIPDSVTKIGQNAFNNNQLEKITIGKNVSTIGNFAFVKNSFNNPNLMTVYNNTNKSFDWGMIINGSGVATEYNFETGTVINALGNIEITKSN